MRSLPLAVVILGFSFMTSPTLISRTAVAAYQERADADRDRPGKPADKKTIGEVTEQLKRSVNGKAMVRNQCLSQGNEVQVEESTEISATDGCNVIFKTRKAMLSQDDRHELEFTLYANLTELTTPASVEPQNSSQCKPVGGAVLKVMGRAEPGKVVRVTRKATFHPANENKTADEPESQTTRNDVSFFFSDAVAAKKAAGILDRAVKLCGGKEWPDEDDLP